MHKSTVSCKRIGILLAVAGLLLTPSSRAAWPFSSKKDKAAEPSARVKGSESVQVVSNLIDVTTGVVTNRKGEFVLRPHLKLDEKSELEFRALISSRYQIQEDVTVLRRIQEEKRQEVLRFTEQLQEDFAIDPKGNYEYDADGGLIKLLTLKADQGAATNTTPAFDRKDHRKLATKEEQDRFVRLVAAKQLSTDQIEGLSLLLQEKLIEMQAVQGSINKKFATTGDRNYRYDREAKMLYEMVPVPQAGASAPVPMKNEEAKQKK